MDIISDFCVSILQTGFKCIPCTIKKRKSVNCINQAFIGRFLVVKFLVDAGKQRRK
jgi:hypothetical protein